MEKKAINPKKEWNLQQIPVKELVISEKLEFGQGLYVYGNSEEFGQNNPQKAKRMNCYNQNEWNYSLIIDSKNLKDNQIDLNFNYFQSQYDKISPDFLELKGKSQVMKIINNIDHCQQEIYKLPIQKTLQQKIKDEFSLWINYQYVNKYYEKVKNPENKQMQTKDKYLWETYLPIKKHFFGTIEYNFYVAKNLEKLEQISEKCLYLPQKIQNQEGKQIQEIEEQKQECQYQYQQQVQQELDINYQLRSIPGGEIVVLNNIHRNEELMKFIEQDTSNQSKFIIQLSENELNYINQKILKDSKNLEKNLIELYNDYTQQTELINIPTKKSLLLKYGEFPSYCTIMQKLEKIHSQIQKFQDQLQNKLIKKEYFTELYRIMVPFNKFLRLLSQNTRIETPQVIYGILFVSEFDDINLVSESQKKSLSILKQLYYSFIDIQNFRFDNILNQRWKILKSNMLKVMKSNVYKQVTKQYYEMLYDDQPQIVENEELLELAMQHTYFMKADSEAFPKIHGKTLKSGNIMIILREDFFENEDQISILDGVCFLTFLHEFKHFLTRYHYFYWNCSEKKGKWEKDCVKQQVKKMNEKFRGQKEGGVFFDVLLFGEQIKSISQSLSKWLLNEQNWENHNNLQDCIHKHNFDYQQLVNSEKLDNKQYYAFSIAQDDLDLGYYDISNLCGQYIFMH